MPTSDSIDVHVTLPPSGTRASVTCAFRLADMSSRQVQLSSLAFAAVNRQPISNIESLLGPTLAALGLSFSR